VASDYHLDNTATRLFKTGFLQRVILDFFQSLVRTPYLVLFTKIQKDKQGYDSLFIGAGDAQTSNPGIIINAKGSLINGPDVDPNDLPQTVIVQNLVEWSGYAEYGNGEDEARWVKEWNAEVYPAQPIPLRVFDPDPNTPNGFYPDHLGDAPTVHAPLKDTEGRRLRRVNYTKTFKAFIGCTLPSDSTFHPVEVVTWRARYKTLINNPHNGIIFLGHSPIRDEDPEPALGQNVNIEPPSASCLTNYINFDGSPTAACN